MEMATTAISKNHSFRTKFIIQENKRFIALKTIFYPMPNIRPYFNIH